MNNSTKEEKNYFKEYSCEEFIDVLASKAAVPGGGGASALVGSIGIALGNMVGSLTVGKKKYKDVEEEIIKCKKEADEIAKEFLELMDKDAQAFEPLSKAYGLPKSTPEEIATKEKVMEEALKEACSVPVEIMKTCARGIDLVEVFAQKGSKIALSDAGVGATLLKSALQGASLNIYINTKSMKDRAVAKQLNQTADSIRKEYEAKADRIFEEVSKNIR
ncbi:cyclodeaminase/cyclohydrolase family protein [Anaerostipes sp. MSJ-23]|uniref:cyclodeaminase/cyclohydrolase family protein n=1 Tax=Anaerostipes sp. MSJ-23 TaxID=2841520 RepID=UPI001C10AE11|nr:cyclodeaminase/cyclohydrolase family protein [Anaerostipes sp. MSJ-23]MBU5459047.1 cyclodeaminase/cyclohydrolase family protein [Anaerostipes sp. MSJ-23]